MHTNNRQQTNNSYTGSPHRHPGVYVIVALVLALSVRGSVGRSVITDAVTPLCHCTFNECSEDTLLSLHFETVASGTNGLAGGTTSMTPCSVNAATLSPTTSNPEVVERVNQVGSTENALVVNSTHTVVGSLKVSSAITKLEVAGYVELSSDAEKQQYGAFSTLAEVGWTADDAFSTSSNWEQKAEAAIDGQDTQGYYGSVFDGRYIYYSPKINDTTYNGIFVRYDTTLEFADDNAWTSYGNAPVNGFSGGVFDGTYIYFTPYRSKSDGNNTIIHRFDTRQTFNISEGWESKDVRGPIDELESFGNFHGGIFDGEYVYFCPHSSTRILRYRTTFEFSYDSSWDHFDMNQTHLTGGWSGMAFDGRYVYLVPNQGYDGVPHAILARYDTQASFSDISSYESMDISAVDGQSGMSKWDGAIYDGSFLYLAPASSGKVVRFDVSQTFATASAWKVFDATSLSLQATGYSLGCFDGRYVYFTPSENGTAPLRFDTNGDFSTAGNWEQIPVWDFQTDHTLTGYAGCSFDGLNVYFVPGDNSATGAHGQFLKYKTSHSAGGFSLGIRAPGMAAVGPTLALKTSDGEFVLSSNYALSGALLSSDTYRHIGGTYDSTTGLLALWIDGSQVASRYISGTPQNLPDAATVNIGAGFEGTIDEVRIMNGVVMNTTSYGCVTTDHSSEPAVSVPNSIKFTGASSVSLPAETGPLTATNMTIEFWLKPARVVARQELISRGPWFINLQDHRISWYMFGASPSEGYWRTKIANPIPIDYWTHFAVTYGDGYLKMYLNGTLNREEEVSGMGHSAEELAESRTVTMGKCAICADGYEFFFKGELDEVRLWNTIRSPSDILAYYQAELTSTQLTDSTLLGEYSFDETCGVTAFGASSGTYNGTIHDAIVTATRVRNPCVGTPVCSSHGTCVGVSALPTCNCTNPWVGDECGVPQVSSITPGGGKPVGGFEITITGANFGEPADTSKVSEISIGGRACTTVTYVSFTEAKCIVPAGVGKSLDVSVTLLGRVSVTNTLFSYDGPVTEYVYPDTGRTYGAENVTIIGYNFGTEDFDPSASVGISTCQQTYWVNDTLVICTTPAGVGTHKDVILTLGNDASQSDNQLFSYKAPTVSYIVPVTGEAVGGNNVTLIGTNFGTAFSETPNITLDYDQCFSTLYLNNSAVVCETPSGYGISRDIIVSMNNLTTVSSGIFTYKSPTISHLLPGSDTFACGGTDTVTIHGVNFGVTDPTPSASIKTNDFDCLTLAWINNTMLTCSPSGYGTNHDLTVSVQGGVSAALTGAISFNIPTVNSLTPARSDTKGSDTVTVNGVDFGYQDPSPSISIDGQACQTSAWSSNTQVTCVMNAGFGGGKDVLVTVDGQTSSAGNSLHYYKTPTISSSGFFSDTDGSKNLTITGDNFGGLENSPAISIDGVGCQSSYWISNTEILCHVPPGKGENYDVGVTIGVNSNLDIVNKLFSYKSPTISWTYPETASPSGISTVSIIGTNFGSSNPSIQIEVSQRTCGNPTYVNNTMVLCKFPANIGGNHRINVTSAGLLGESDPFFQYGGPEVYSVDPTSVNVGGATVTISGTSFGLESSAVVASVNNRTCISTTYISNEQMLCHAPPGVGFGRDVVVTVASQTGVGTAVLTYDRPTVTAVSPLPVPAAEGAAGQITVSVDGANFGTEEHADWGIEANITFGDFGCSDVAWVSNTRLTCTSDNGYGKDLSARVTIDGQATNISNTLFQYAVPTVSAVDPDRGVAAGGENITIQGSNFGGYDMGNNLTASIGTGSCTVMAFISNTAVRCETPIGKGFLVDVVVTTGNTDSGTSGNDIFTYKGPTVASLLPDVAYGAGGENITVLGTNFGAAGAVIDILVNSTSCVQSYFVNDTHVICESNPGAGKDGIVVVSTNGITSPSEVDGLFSYRIPTVSYTTPGTAATDGGETISVVGVNFGGASHSDLGMTIGGLACAGSVSWINNTLIVCSNHPAGVGGLKDVVTEIRTQSNNISLSGVDYGYQLFSYKAPTVTSIDPNVLPTSGGVTTISGANFGSSGDSRVTTVGGIVCTESAFTSSNQIECNLAQGFGTRLNISMILELLPSVGETELFSFKAPTVNSIAPTTSYADGSSEVTVTGSNFGFLVSSGHETNRQWPVVNATIGASSCQLTVWVSDTTMRCQVPKGYGIGKEVLVTVSNSTSATGNSLYTYMGPTITAHNPTGGPTDGSTSITVSGRNFGGISSPINITVEHVECTGSSYVSDTTAVCHLPPGTGTSKTVRAYIGELHVDGLQNSFTYGSPQVYYSFPTTASTDGSETISIVGLNFGGPLDPRNVEIGGVNCISVGHINSTWMRCVPPTGYGVSKEIVATISGQISSVANTIQFSYKVPTITSVLPFANGDGSSTVTLAGSNFGATSNSLTISLGNRTCTTPTYISNTAAHCHAPAGYGKGIHASITVSGQISLLGNTLFSYKIPTVSSIVPDIENSSGAGTMTITGTNFGTTILTVDPVQSVSIDGISCPSTVYVSNTVMHCIIPPGFGIENDVIVTSSTLVSDSVGNKLFTYKSPTVTGITPDTAATDGSEWITILGSNFGGITSDVSSTVGTRKCKQTVYISDTQAKCQVAQGYGYMFAVTVTVESQEGTDAHLFSYKSPTLSGITPDTGRTYGRNEETVTVHGTNFGGESGLSLSVSLMNITCLSQGHINNTHVYCGIPGGYGASRQIDVTIAGLVSVTPNQYFTYFSPTVRRVYTGIESTHGGSITIMGYNFGALNNSMEATIHSVSCTNPLWVSDRAMTCVAPSGIGYGKDVRVTATSQTSTPLTAFSYDIPYVTAVVPDKGRTIGNEYVTIYGGYYGVSDFTPEVTIGNRTATNVTWISDDIIIVTTPAGINSTRHIGVTVGNQTNVDAFLFSYKVPTVSYVLPNMVLHDGGETVTVIGDNFGPSITLDGQDPVTFVDGIKCTTTTYISETAVRCVMPEVNPDPHHLVEVAVGDLISQSEQGVSKHVIHAYSVPEIIRVDPEVGSTLGWTLTVYGRNFGSANSTGSNIEARNSTALVGGRPVTSLSWVNDTMIVLVAPPNTGFGRDVQVFVDTIASNVWSSVTYKSPTVTAVRPSIIDTRGAMITALGHNFGLTSIGSTVAAEVATVSCTSPTVLSDTMISCIAPAGTGTAKNVAVTVEGQASSTTPTFLDYENPVISKVTPNHGPAAGTNSITILGNGFGVADPSSRIRIGWVDCAATSWVSDLEVHCQIPPGIGTSFQVHMVTDGQNSTYSYHIQNNIVLTEMQEPDGDLIYSYDAPVISSISPNVVSTNGSGLITISGLNFGTTTNALTATFGTNSCDPAAAWVSDQAVTCGVPRGTGTGYEVQVTVAAQTSSPNTAGDNVVSYFAPQVHNLTLSNTTTRGGVITVRGNDFGSLASAASLTVAGQTCRIDSLSDHIIECYVATGSGVNHNVTLTVSGQEAFIDPSVRFSYDRPFIAGISPESGGTDGAYSLTISGSSFGVSSEKITVWLAKDGHTFSCSSVGLQTWRTDWDLITCSLESGHFEHLSMNVLVDGQYSEGLAYFSYDIPVVTSVLAGDDSLTPTRSAAVGGLVVTVNGNNFGALENSDSRYNPPRSVSIDGHNCTSVTYVSDNQLWCTTPPLVGRDLSVVVTLGHQVNVANTLFSYKIPTVTGLNPSNGTTAGNEYVTILGNNFGITNYTNHMVNASIGGLPCVDLLGGLLLSNTAVLCASPANTGPSQEVQVTVSGQVGSGSPNVEFTYNAPEVNSITPSARFATDNTDTITISGRYFGAVGHVLLHASLGTFSCLQTLWVDDQQILCSLPQGTGEALDVHVAIYNVTATGIGLFSYKIPSVTAITPTTASTSLSEEVTIEGSNFGVSSTALTASIGSDACVNPTHVSNTRITCKVPVSGGSLKVVSATVTSQVGVSPTEIFSYKVPTVNFISDSGILPTAGGHPVTIWGANFGPGADTLYVSIFGRNCTGVTHDHNHAYCTSPMGYGVNRDIVATVVKESVVRSASAALITYKAPTITAISTSLGDAEGGTLMYMTGSSFGGEDTTPSAFVNGLLCEQTAWISDTYASCNVPIGIGTAANITIDVSTQVSTELPNFSYKSPTVSYVSPATGATAGGFWVTVHGKNFGNATAPTYLDDRRLYGSIGGNNCSNINHVNDTMMECLAPLGTGFKQSVLVTIGLQSSTANILFSYKIPTVASVTAVSRVTTGGVTVTISGSNFGVIDSTPSASITQPNGVAKACTGVTWVSDQALTCVLPAGRGIARNTLVTVHESVSTDQFLFTYDIPVITKITPDVASTNGYSTHTVEGSNFGTETPLDNNFNMTIGALEAIGHLTWASDSQFLAVFPPGVGADKEILVTLYDAVSSPTYSLFSYKSPTITQVTPNHGDKTGAAGDILTIEGSNFGNSSGVATATIGGVSCSSTVWQSHSRILCTSAGGASAATYLRVQVTVESQSSDGSAVPTIYAATETQTKYLFKYWADCPGEPDCSNNGACSNNGICTCNTDYVSADCASTGMIYSKFYDTTNETPTFNTLNLNGDAALVASSSLTINRSNFSDSSQPVISTTLTDVLRLTPSETNKVGSAWSDVRKSVTSGFETQFEFAFTNFSMTCKNMQFWGDNTNTEYVPDVVLGQAEPKCKTRGGEGIAFVLHNDASGASTIGSLLGYEGIQNSIAIEFDTWFNYETEDPYENHVAVVTRGSMGLSTHHKYFIGQSADHADFQDGNSHTARIVYTSNFQLLNDSFVDSMFQASKYSGESFISQNGMGLLSVYVDSFDKPLFSVAINLEETLGSADAWVGFTGATGQIAFENHDILNWRFCSADACGGNLFDTFYYLGSTLWSNLIQP